VPVQSLFEYVEAGDTVDEFLDAFPSVSRAHVVAVLELARREVEGQASAA
jgi:uncharacterized protein (DUF433 family)